MSTFHHCRRSKADKLLAVLRDGYWHSTRELVNRVGHTFGMAKFTLVNKRSCQIEKRRHPYRHNQYQYRLVLS